METSIVRSVPYMVLLYMVRNQIMSLFYQVQVGSSVCMPLVLENEEFFGGSIMISVSNFGDCFTSNLNNM